MIMNENAWPVGRQCRSCVGTPDTPGHTTYRQNNGRQCRAVCRLSPPNGKAIKEETEEGL